MSLMLVNESTSATVASRVELALDRGSRRRGLLGRAWLPPTSALVLSPCWMVHTAFMKFPIDVLFVDRRGQVVSIVPSMRSWRIAASTRANLVIELAAGAAAQRDIKVGDCVTFVETGQDRSVPAVTGPLPLQVRAC